ncbi:hypothetical protein PCANC_02652 [Puccinia coronata f. sp. avenae]|uniref:Endonuclease/exonuclease/phosphatase domain-containing protein n=1 Tax=Puccinia coronata f. sp. avenae TaxID=200324 RepID=A0A2N5W5D9_9BASI|nr:hypothetical protein PCASD_19358 [Puccinia coronata f. sp. avenae]PLW41473.1 hypothetical protein PCASD_07186 [Puccinia coronata f. sp. avenae]PLW57454.1 hypothetical protein PCANC_02652 [Puccinia coronata f. sp. avenae]
MEEDHAIEEKRRFRAEKKKRQAEKKALQAAADINAPPITHNDDSLSTSHPSTAKANYTLRHLKPVLKGSNSIHETTHHDGGTRSLQIMTWNVLAQCLVRRSLFPGSDCLKWKDRGPTIAQEIVDYEPDVICLQEVDRLGDHETVLHDAGYQLVHVIGGYEWDGKQHGLLVGWKDALLSLAGQKVIRLDEQEFQGRIGLSRVTRNVGLVVGLRFKDNPAAGLVIGTAHLFWHARYTYERTRQTAFLAQALRDFRAEQHPHTTTTTTTSTTTQWPVFLAGDLNEQPGGPSYRLLCGAPLPEKEKLILEESTLVHKSVDQLRLKTLQDEQYTTLEGDEDRVFKDVRAATPQDGLFDMQELAQIFGPHTWLSLYGHWARHLAGEEGNRFMDRPELKAQSSALPGASGSCPEDGRGSGSYEPMWTNFTPLWRCTLDYIWVLSDGGSGESPVEALALLPTHRTETLEPGLPRLGVEPSDHIPLMAQVRFPCPP